MSSTNTIDRLLPAPLPFIGNALFLNSLQVNPICSNTGPYERVVARFTTPTLNLQVTNNYGDSSRTSPPLLSDNHEPNDTRQITSTCSHPYLTVEPHYPETSQTLNYSDLNGLLLNINMLPVHIQSKVRTIADKVRTQPDDFWYDGYYPQTSLISLSESKISQSVCRCGFKPGRNFTSPGLCHKPRLCLKCARIEARSSLDVFKPHFDQHSWGFLTVSFHGNLAYSPTTSPAQWWRYWDASSMSVRNLRKFGHIQGAIIREELAINAIAPIRIIPHVHAIVSYPDITQSVQDELAFDVYSALENAGEDAPLHPSVHFEPLLTEMDFVRVWHYIYKPTLFYSAYEAKWNDDATPHAKNCLNQSMRTAIDAAIHIPSGRRQTHYLGNMRSGRRDFIGISRAAKA